MSNPKNLFEWLNEITFKKTPINQIEEEAWNKWNSYMINRYVSMNKDYVHLANLVQTFPPKDKKQLYSAYRQLIPKKKVWLKYIKNQSQPNKELLEILSKYFESNSREVEEYLKILDKNEIKSILVSMGFDDKEIKKLKI